MEMNKYANGKIYMIITENSNDIYVGSTIRTLKARLQLHESEYRTGVYCSSQEILKQGNYKIVLIKNYPCSSKLELEREETKFQRDLVCVNKHLARRTKKEWLEDNKEVISAKKKEYYIKNKEVISAKKKEYREQNKGAISAKSKEYNIKNREVISAKKKEYREQNKEKLYKKINCECGGKYIHVLKSTHFKTLKHQKFKNTKNT
jgi:hypothetical protein